MPEVNGIPEEQWEGFEAWQVLGEASGIGGVVADTVPAAELLGESDVAPADVQAFVTESAGKGVYDARQASRRTNGEARKPKHVRGGRPDFGEEVFGVAH